MTPRSSFSCRERRGGGGGDRKKTSRSIRGGRSGLSATSSRVEEGMHQIRILAHTLSQRGEGTNLGVRKEKTR
jgi:hypothetical protein